MANKRRKGDEERPPIADGMLDPLDNFVGRFRMMCGGDADDPKASMDRQVIQLIRRAAGP